MGFRLYHPIIVYRISNPEDRRLVLATREVLRDVFFVVADEEDNFEVWPMMECRIADIQARPGHAPPNSASETVEQTTGEEIELVSPPPEPKKGRKGRK